MRFPDPQRSYCYGDPLYALELEQEIAEQKQNAEISRACRAIKRPSAARRAAEALFESGQHDQA